MPNSPDISLPKAPDWIFSRLLSMPSRLLSVDECFGVGSEVEKSAVEETLAGTVLEFSSSVLTAGTWLGGVDWLARPNISESPGCVTDGAVVGGLAEESPSGKGSGGLTGSGIHEVGQRVSHELGQ